MTYCVVSEIYVLQAKREKIIFTFEKCSVNTVTAYITGINLFFCIMELLLYKYQRALSKIFIKNINLINKDKQREKGHSFEAEMDTKKY